MIPVEHHDGELLGAHAQGTCGEITVEGGCTIRVRDRLDPDGRRAGGEDAVQRDKISLVEDESAHVNQFWMYDKNNEDITDQYNFV